MELIKPSFLTAAQVAELLGVSPSKAYKIINKLNKELNDMGKITIAGKVSKKFFIEKTNC